MNTGGQQQNREASPSRDISPTLVVLAAGMGSRFGGLKQVAAVNAAGESLLYYSVYDAVRAGFQRVVFVIRREMEHDFSAVGSRFARRMDVAYAFQQLDSLLPFAPPAGRTKPWGTLQATLVAADGISGPFAVINADDFYGLDSYRVLADSLRDQHSGRPMSPERHRIEDARDQAGPHLKSEMWGTPSVGSAMVGFRLRNTLSDFGSVSRGVCQVDSNGMLQRVQEMKRIARSDGGALNTGDDGSETRLSGDELVSMNLWGFQPSVVPLLREAFQAFLSENGTNLTAEAYLPMAVNGLLAERKLQVAALETSSVWCGITYREDLPGVVQRIGQMTRSGEYPEVLWP